MSFLPLNETISSLCPNIPPILGANPYFSMVTLVLLIVFMALYSAIKYRKIIDYAQCKPEKTERELHNQFKQVINTVVNIEKGLGALKESVDKSQSSDRTSRSSYNGSDKNV